MATYNRTSNININFVIAIIFAFWSLELNAVTQSNSFMDERYIGWYWFDELKANQEAKNELPEQPASKQPKLEDYLANEQEMKDFSRRLELKRFMMIMHPNNLEYIKQYKEMESIMRDNAETLAKNYALVNFLHPELFNQLKRPINLYGRKLKEKHQQGLQQQDLKRLAQEFELFVFLSNSDPYSPTLDKHLSNFNKKYGYEITAITKDGSNSAYFKTHFDSGGVLSKALSMQVTPSILAISKDSKERYEIARGAVSISEIEQSLLLIKRARSIPGKYQQTGKTDVR